MKIGIIGAMEVEIELLKERLGDFSVSMFAGMKFYEGSLGDVPAVVVQCGVGKVNSAICVQLLVDQFQVTNIINTGVGGALHPDLRVGDIVVSTDAVHHDMDVTNLGYLPGQVPGMQLLFGADMVMHKQAVAAVKEVAPEINVISGRIASGDQFIYEKAKKDYIRETFNSACCEMEGASIAHACTLNDVPFVIVRAISDNADGSDAEAYPVFEEKAARHCAAIVEYLVSNLK